jgi:hypothetical protein
MLFENQDKSPFSVNIRILIEDESGIVRKEHKFMGELVLETECTSNHLLRHYFNN